MPSFLGEASEHVEAAMAAEEVAALRPRLVKTLHRQKQLSDALLLGPYDDG